MVPALIAGATERGPVAQTDHRPQQNTKLAYDRPLPDSVKRAIIDVTVIDAVTKSPIGLAEILILNYVDLRYHRFPTDRRGRVRFAYPYADTPEVSLEVRKEGYVPRRSGWGLEKKALDAPRQVTIALRRGVEIGGIVLDERGQPIEGVTVVVTVDDYGLGGRLKEPLGEEILYEVPFATARDGRWHTRSCPPSAKTLALQLIHPDYVSAGCSSLGGPGLRHPSLQALRQRTDSQVMSKGVRVSGRVTDVAGDPIPGARICDSSMGQTFLSYVLHTETDLDGRFHFHFKPGENIKLTAQVDGFEPMTKSLVVHPDQNPVQFQLATGKKILGRVVDRDGEGIPGAVVFIPRFTKHEGVFLRTLTDSEGRFAWASAPSEPVEFSIYKDGYLGLDRLSFTAADEESTVVLQRGVTVVLGARDATTGQRINEFSIETGSLDLATGMTSWKPGLTATVAGGEYRTTLTTAGAPYQFRIKAAGYKTNTSRVLKGGERDFEEVIDLKRTTDH
jgi:protocatechuate 3,4-dioxygenase beta subunit